MAGVRPIRRYNSALCLVEPRAIVVLSFRAATPYRATPCHGVALRSTLCSRPTAIPNLRSRLVETQERWRSHIGHSHSCDSAPTEEVRPAPLPDCVALHRPPQRDALRSRDKYPRERSVSSRRRSSAGTLNSRRYVAVARVCRMRGQPGSRNGSLARGENRRKWARPILILRRRSEMILLGNGLLTAPDRGQV